MAATALKLPGIASAVTTRLRKESGLASSGTSKASQKKAHGERNDYTLAGEAFAIGDGGGRRLAEPGEGDLNDFSPASWVIRGDEAAAGPNDAGVSGGCWRWPKFRRCQARRGGPRRYQPD